jgi:2-dehydro-3-deoxyphosphogluconate aldolase / (4S)-4-hydroxy-2-oxoglutarate aldolase
VTATIRRPPLSDRLTNSKVIAVLRASHVSALTPVCDVLVEEGILSLELTLTTADLLNSLRELVNRYADAADVGVGTILNESEAEHALECGARFLVTPTMNLPVVRLAVQRQVAVFPGGLTPTELAAGWHAGASAVKIFPAQTVGPEHLRHLRGPFPELQAFPSGGVDLDASREWLAAGAAAVSIGGPLLGDALNGGDLGALRDRCRALRAVVGETVHS